MNIEAAKRRKLAGRLAKKMQDMVTGVLLAGSVAFAPEAVTTDSDIDLIAVTPFGRTNFKGLYDALGHPYEPKLAEYARDELFGNFTLDWDVEEITVQLHVWSLDAFADAVNLEAYQRRFARRQYHAQLNCARPQEVLRNLKGEEVIIERTPIANLNEDKIIPLYVCYEDRSGIYLGVPATNLLLEPMVLCQKGDYVSSGISYFKAGLAKKIRKKHCDKPNTVSLFNALTERIQAKIRPDLRSRLDNLLRNPNT
ncbi:hypothetical protein KY310_02360 [Candidatus Woesearchaeota archaeon]|nr:hypothetical protein [Candidatus Woesearchaeota archaeon]